jgi:hypothetical protein
MDTHRGRATSGAARFENGQTFDRPEIKTDCVSNSQATEHLEQTPAGRDRAEGKTKMKWTSNTRVLVCIIAALLFTIWFALWLQYY